MKKNKIDMMKIRMAMDNKHYHLHEECKWDENNNLIETWKLFEKHDDWMIDDSEAIMTSEENTIEELYKFVKEHREVDLESVLAKSTPIIFLIITIIAIINIFIHDTLLRGVILGADLIGIIYILIRYEVSEKNFKFRMKKLDEYWNKKFEEVRKKNENKTNDISKR